LLGRKSEFAGRFVPKSSRRTKVGTVRSEIGKFSNEIKPYGPNGFLSKTVVVGVRFRTHPLSSRPYLFLGSGRRDDFHPTEKTMPHETRSISFAEPIKALHPDTGKPVKVVGVTDEQTILPKLVILVTDVWGTHAETVDTVDNDRG